jgi:hypothetical protein
MRKPISTALASLLLCALPASAAIQGFFTTLSGTYIVPTGKVLVLQAVAPPSSDPTANILQLTPAGGGATLQLRINASSTNGLYALPVEMNLPAGTSINSVGMGLFGLLVDPQDLYVGIRSTLTDPAYAGGSFKGSIKLASAAPPSIRFQTSPDLASWQYDSRIALQPTIDKTNVLFSALADGPDRFYRTTVRHR